MRSIGAPTAPPGPRIPLLALEDEMVEILCREPSVRAASGKAEIEQAVSELVRKAAEIRLPEGEVLVRHMGKAG